MTVEEYIKAIPEDRSPVFKKIRKIIKEHLPKGFEECISYKMIGYVVPKSIYPEGYHCDTTLPLPFMNLANQKHYIALYHSGIYADPDLFEWLINEYANHCKYKIDMGRSCVRFKRMDDIPYDLIRDLVKMMSVDDWITLYEENTKSQKK